MELNPSLKVDFIFFFNCPPPGAFLGTPLDGIKDAYRFANKTVKPLSSEKEELGDSAVLSFIQTWPLRRESRIPKSPV